MTPAEFERWYGVQKNGHTNMNVKGPVSMRNGMEMLYYMHYKNNGVVVRSRYRP